MDPWVVAGIAGAYAGKKLLGPSLNVVGETLARWTDQRVKNVGRIMRNAEARLPYPDQPGSVPARLAMRVFEEGSYSDEPIVVEYLGGVLASARTPAGRDDRGVAWTALVSRLSTYELRTHYILYAAARGVLAGRVETLKDATITWLFISFDSYHAAMEFETDEWFTIFAQSFYGLHREGLVGNEFGFGSPDAIKQGHPGRPEVPSDGILFQVSRAGMSLFLWGLGEGPANPHIYLNPEVALGLIDLELQVPEAQAILGPAAEEDPQ